MIDERKFKLRKLALLALLLPMSSWGAEIPPATVVRFNTVCANCHEGECSGRLSFQSGVDAAANHLRRFLGALSEREMADLFALLKFTKEQCRQYPVESAIPVNGRWGVKELEIWRNPVEGGYFIPLGALKSGAYQVTPRFVGDPQGKVRVTDERFEIAGEEHLSRGSQPVLRFTASGGEHYLHVQGSGTLQGLELGREP